MKNKKYYFLLFFIISNITIIKSSKVIKEVFPFYPYDEILEKNFEDYCLSMNLKKDCILEKLSKLDIKNITKISYDFIKSNNNKQEEEDEDGIDKNDLKDIVSSYDNDFFGVFGGNIVDGISSLIKYGKITLNDKNDKIILEIEEILNNEKYKKLVNEWFEEDIIKLLDEGVSQIDKNLYISDFFTNQQNMDKPFDLNSKFKANINSLNFVVFSKNNDEKSKFISNLLSLKSEIDESEDNGDDKITTSIEFTKYKNNNKKGLELFASKRNEINNIKKEIKEFNSFLKNNIITNENNFIYGFIYLSDINSFEEKDLNQLYENNYGKIPLKKIKFINGKFSKNDFIKDILEELNEKKLKDIYKYYYSLNVYNILKYKILLINQLVDIFSSITKSEKNIKNIDDAANLIINKLKLNINTLLLRPNLNYEEMTEKIKSIYSKLFEELNKDIKDKNIDYTLEENKSSFNIFNYFIENHPNDIIPIFLFEKIRILLEKIFKNKIKDMIISYSFNIEKYPDYLNILENINKNFITFYYWPRILIFALISIIILLLVYYCFIRKKSNKKNKNIINQGGEELKEVFNN